MSVLLDPALPVLPVHATDTYAHAYREGYICTRVQRRIHTHTCTEKDAQEHAFPSWWSHRRLETTEKGALNNSLNLCWDISVPSPSLPPSLCPLQVLFSAWFSPLDVSPRLAFAAERWWLLQSLQPVFYWAVLSYPWCEQENGMFCKLASSPSWIRVFFIMCESHSLLSSFPFHTPSRSFSLFWLSFYRWSSRGWDLLYFETL